MNSITLNSLDNWTSSGNIDEAKERLVKASETEQNSLDLSNLNLIYIHPAIGELKKLTTLILEGNNLQLLPLEIVPLTALTSLNLKKNRFEFLQDIVLNLTGLKKLYLRECYIEELPTEIGRLTCLTELYLSNNSLSFLPTEIGLLTSLRELGLGGNYLTCLPKEIEGLTALSKLYLPMNKLTSLPREIGKLICLSELHLSHNSALTSLPQEIGQLVNLTVINITENPRLGLPLSLGQIPGLIHIDTFRTGINHTICDAILNQCRLMRDAEAVRILPARLAKWKAIAYNWEDMDVNVLSDDQKKTLNEWLHRLEKTGDFASLQRQLACKVCSIVDDVLKTKEFQGLFFPQAEANNACCEDRAAMSLNEIYTSWALVCHSADLSLLTGVAKTLCLRKELQKQIMTEERESVEIFLYYESSLRERLQLATAIHNMTYDTIGKRLWIDEEQLAAHVNAHFFEELFELPVFQKMVADERQWKDIDLEFSEKLGECPKGNPYDEQILEYQHRQGVIMQEWKRKKMAVARAWYEEHYAAT